MMFKDTTTYDDGAITPQVKAKVTRVLNKAKPRPKKPEPKYLSARKLKIREVERTYLIKTVEHLEKVKGRKPLRIGSTDLRFNMKIEYFVPSLSTKEENVCNAVGCIKGWCGYLAQKDGEQNKLRDFGHPGWWNESCPLHELFYPIDVFYGSVTPKQAAAVTKHFLQTGDVNWHLQ